MPGTIAHSRRTEPSRAALGPSSATAAVPILAHTHHAFAMLAGTKAKRGAFADQYRTLCTYAKQYPLSYVLTPTFHHSVTLRVPADKVVTESDWDLLLASLAMADDLRGVCIWSVWWFEKRRTLAKLPAEKDAKRVKDNLRAKIPLVLHAEIAEPLVRAVAGAMRQCKLLATVALAGVILRPASVRLLAAALVRSSSLCTLSLARCEIGDEGFHELAGAIKSSQSLQILDLADNHLTHQSASLLADALKSQSVRRVEAAFPHLLRSGSSRTNMNLALHRKSFDSAFGSSLPPHHHNQHHPSDHADPNLHHAARPTTVVIKRVTLSCNPLGDAGLYHLLDALQSDIGVQALDLQHTRITNHGAEAALMVLSDVEGAAALDIRNNADVDPLLIKQVTEIGAAQCAHDPELARLPDGAHPLDSSLFRAAVPSRPAATGTATSRTVTHSGSEKPRTRTAPRPPALPRAAWRPAGKLPPPTVTTASLAAKQTKKRAEERTHLGWNPLVSVVDLVDVMETNRQLEGKVMALESAVLRHAQESPIVVAVPAGQQQPEYDSYDWDPRFARAAGYGGNGMVASSYQQYPQQQQALHYDSETDAMYRPADRPITPYAALGPMHPSGGAEPEHR
ncbi:hypothetical protein BC828DRAFT_135216 [Blastocladiella britannica]|nr:hypothetical protein BC828DRAFT_135216 [Blastocladiella britannica]